MASDEGWHALNPGTCPPPGGAPVFGPARWGERPANSDTMFCPRMVVLRDKEGWRPGSGPVTWGVSYRDSLQLQKH